MKSNAERKCEEDKKREEGNKRGGEPVLVFLFPSLHFNNSFQLVPEVFFIFYNQILVWFIK